MWDRGWPVLGDRYVSLAEGVGGQMPDASLANTIGPRLRDPNLASSFAIRWPGYTVQGFISGRLGEKMGLSVLSFRPNGEPGYALKG